MAELKGKLKQALSDLTILHPFWATLVIHMPIDEAKDDLWTNMGATPTFATDGRRIFYSKSFSESLSRGVNMFALAHEAGHPMFHHMTRIFNKRAGRNEIYGFREGKPLYWDPTLWNIAGDFIINNALKDCGFELWKPQTLAQALAGGKGCLCDPQFNGMTTEQVYDKIEQQSKQNQAAGGKGISLDAITGQDIMSPATGFTEEEAKEIIHKAAAIARAQGKLPASLEELIKEATEPQYPVYHVLERFIDSHLRDDDHTWAIPNRKYLPYGILQPSPWSDKVGDVTIFYDTSGSVPGDDLSRFHRVAGDILRYLKPNVVRVGQCDATVHKVDVFERGDLAKWEEGIKMTGRGGTDFRPPFKWLEEQRITPSCLVYLTDMMGTFPDHAPSYPVLWVSTDKSAQAPFGMTIYLNHQ